uniref:Uncharacterized protein n=1 Tax=Megaviridae environmental sample TaxID=1737588 RepID=A0A5J6VHC0_9VIRU|nr:MAG: hypothetical protein [Megaviridae environmental sample]
MARIIDVAFANISNQSWDWWELSRDSTLTHKDVRKHINAPWDWDVLSKKPKMIPVILSNPTAPWKWWRVSSMVSIKTIIENLNLPWVWSIITSRADLSIKVIRKYPDVPWDYNILSNSSFLTIDDILRKPNANWNWSILTHIACAIHGTSLSSLYDPPFGALYNISYNALDYFNRIASELTNHITLQHICENTDLPWNWQVISTCNGITLDYILETSHLPWDWSYITIKSSRSEILANPDAPWQLEVLSCNPNIKLEDIIEYPSIPWNWQDLQMHIPMCEITSNPRLPWAWDTLHYHKEFTSDIIDLFPNKPWNYHQMGGTTIINTYFVNIDYILKHKHQSWNWLKISVRSDLTMEQVLAHPDVPWCYNVFCDHVFITEYNARNIIAKWSQTIVRQYKHKIVLQVFSDYILDDIIFIICEFI